MAVERKLIDENKKRLLMREFLYNETARAGFGECDIQRTPLGIRVHLVVERPGFVIGRRGSTIKRITQDMEDLFGLENPQIEVEESENPNLNPSIMAQKLAEALERGWHFRRAGHSTVRRIIESGARGCQVTLTGKLTGSRGRQEKFIDGHIKHCGEPAEQFMKHGYALCKKKLGTIGVKVSIMDADARLPDEVTVLPGRTGPAPASSLPPTMQTGEAEAEPAAEAAAEPTPEPAAPAAAAAPAESEPEDLEAPVPKPGGSGTKRKLTDIPGIGPAKAKAMEEAGYDFDAVVEASVSDLADLAGIGPKTAEQIKKALDEMGVAE